jgi:ADP-ribosylation factor-like protein 8
MWERYCKGVSAIIFVLDAADQSTVEPAKTELHGLMSRESLQGIPLLVLANKNDLDDALKVDEVIEQLDLKSITDRQVSCYSISVKEANNLNSVLSWLISRSKS